ncbi:GntR family transcriptional regulator [Streptomyces durmitorensis]|uniref:GntR family transcriptional regulator n=1 Tax=Streptomyces durmitorensis TaxID=319947 RepID=A0ABY4PL03_9ACTN|nr:GntR family transcriptional regulator [Streptomyces durmitorensis]UQT54391.1 GntR family transcriptional regulator [Streptomyces durmitorensis]
MAPRKGEPGRYVAAELAAEFRALIQSGELLPGAQLPSEAALKDERSLSNAAVRAAYERLMAEGLAVSRHGKGVYVLDPKRLVRTSPRRFARGAQSIQSADLEGREPDVQVDVDEVATASDRVVEILGAGPFCRRSRLFSLDGRKLQLATSYLPAGLAVEAGVDQTDTGSGGMYERLAEVGRRPVKACERVYGRVATSEEAQALGLSKGMSIFLIERVAYDEEGRAVEVNEMTLDASKYILEYEFPI